MVRNFSRKKKINNENSYAQNIAVSQLSGSVNVAARYNCVAVMLEITPTQGRREATSGPGTRFFTSLCQNMQFAGSISFLGSMRTCFFSYILLLDIESIHSLSLSHALWKFFREASCQEDYIINENLKARHPSAQDQIRGLGAKLSEARDVAVFKEIY